MRRALGVVAKQASAYALASLLVGYYLLATAAFQLAPVAEVAVLLSTSPVFVLSIRRLRGEPVRRRQAAGALLALSGIAIVVAPGRAILDGAIAGWEKLDDMPELVSVIRAVARHAGFDPQTPWNRLPASAQRAILYGLGETWLDADCLGPGVRVQWKGFFPAIDEAVRTSWQYRQRLSHLMGEVPCRRCRGGRLREDAAAVRLGGRTLPEVCFMPLGEAYRFFSEFRLDPREKQIAGEVLHEVTSRLKFLVDVGLDYVTLHRAAPTLSGGESQRIRLASQIGSGLTGVLYVLDEPTIGLHPRDNLRLINALRHLRDLGNTLLMVEHDREVEPTLCRPDVRDVSAPFPVRLLGPEVLRDQVRRNWPCVLAVCGPLEPPFLPCHEAVPPHAETPAAVCFRFP